jgi:DNA-binding IscR family transcriptional regulator
MERTDITVNEKVMLTVLSTFAERDGTCSPSVGEIATRAGVSDRYVQTLCGRLVEVGLITRERRGSLPNVYRILWFDELDSSEL